MVRCKILIGLPTDVDWVCRNNWNSAFLEGYAVFTFPGSLLCFFSPPNSSGDRCGKTEFVIRSINPCHSRYTL